MIIGYARCSTDAQDLTAQRQQLAVLGAAPAGPDSYPAIRAEMTVTTAATGRAAPVRGR